MWFLENQTTQKLRKRLKINDKFVKWPKLFHFFFILVFEFEEVVDILLLLLLL